MLRRLATASALLLLAAPAARAQDLAEICRRVMRPPVGAWSQYTMVGGSARGATMRVSAVGTETHADTSLLWLEFAVRAIPAGAPDSSSDTISVVNKLLVTGFGPGMSEPHAHILKFGSAPAMTMPVGQGPGADTPGSTTMQDCAGGKVLGWESVTVPAGTFRAVHLQNAEGKADAWIVPDLPFGLVKAATSGEEGDSGEMVLTAHGMGANSLIAEAPRPYDPQLLIQLMTGGGRRQ